MVVIGGMASVWGAMIGAALLTLLPQYLRVFHDYDILIYGFTLLLIMIFLPQGLFAAIIGLLKKKKEHYGSHSPG
jgi:branched-chain amino acid transport system permease protein